MNQNFIKISIRSWS